MNAARKSGRYAGNEQRLDVRVRSRTASGGGFRWGRWLVVLMLGVGVWFGWRELRALVLYQWMYRTPAFAVRVLRVETDGVLTPEDILITAGVKKGQNLLALDLPALRDRLKSHPRIEEASVERVLPGELRLTVRERLPIAQVRVMLGDVKTGMLVDAQGYPFRPLEHGRAGKEQIEAEAALPLLLNPANADFTAGRPASQPEILAALQFLQAFDRTDLAGMVEIWSVDVGARGVLQAYTTQGSTVTFKPAQFEEQLRDWMLVWAEGARRGKAIATLDLAVGRNVPLRWQEGGAPASPSTPRPAKPKRNRRQHV